MAQSGIDTFGEQDAAAPQFDSIRVLLRHKLLITLFGVMGAALGYLHYVRQPRVYESSASLLVIQEKASNLPIKNLESSRTLEDSNLSTQMLVIRSPLVIDKAAAHPDLQKLRSLSNTESAGAAIGAGLSVGQARTENGTLAKDVLLLTMRGDDPQDCAALLKIVISAYQQFLGETRQSINSETVDLITKAKDSLLNDLSQKERKFREFQQDVPLIWAGDQGKNFHQDRLAGIEEARSKLLIDRTQLKSQIQSIEAAIARGENREALVLMANQLAARNEREMPMARTKLTLAEQLVELAIEEQMLLDRVGSNHPKVQAMQRRIEVMTKLAADGEAPAAKPKNGNAPDVVVAYLGSIKQELATLESQEAELGTLFDAEQKDARDFSRYEIESLALQTEIARTKQLFDGVIKRLDEISLIKDIGGVYTQTIMQPRIGVQVQPRLATTLAVGILAGLGLGFLCGAAFELSNREFRSLDEVSRQLGVSIMGHFPRQAPTKTRSLGSLIDITVSAHHQPKSSISEAYRGIRTSLYFSTRDQAQRHKVIQLTSPLPGDGKTTLSANLAVTIAQSGKSVLFLEADLRRPRAARLFGVTAETGLTAALNGEREIDECIHDTEIANLSLLPVETRPFNPSELLGSSTFREMLDVLREKFDFVLIDSPPVLPVTDASIIATIVDGVVVLLSARKDMRSAAITTVEKLRAVGAPLLGIIMRGALDSRDGNRREFSYQYGYEEVDHEEMSNDVPVSNSRLGTTVQMTISGSNGH